MAISSCISLNVWSILHILNCWRVTVLFKLIYQNNIEKCFIMTCFFICFKEADKSRILLYTLIFVLWYKKNCEKYLNKNFSFALFKWTNIAVRFETTEKSRNTSIENFFMFHKKKEQIIPLNISRDWINYFNSVIQLLKLILCIFSFLWAHKTITEKSKLIEVKCN